MSEYTFKNLNEIDTVTEPADGTTMMGFQNGIPIQMPMSAVKSGGGVFIIDTNDPEFSTTDTAYGNKIKEALLSGKTVWIHQIVKATTTSNTDDSFYDLATTFNLKQRTTGEWDIILNDAFGLPITIEE